MIMITQLNRRNMGENKDAIRQHIAAYNARGFNVNDIKQLVHNLYIYYNDFFQILL